jgi:hypothetical protein
MQCEPLTLQVNHPRQLLPLTTGGECLDIVQVARRAIDHSKTIDQPMGLPDARGHIETCSM